MRVAIYKNGLLRYETVPDEEIIVDPPELTTEERIAELEAALAALLEGRTE